MYLLRPYYRQISLFLSDCSNRSFRIAAMAICSILGVFFFLNIYLGATVMSGRPWDVPILLGGAWRVLNGQIPHNDFFTPLGALPMYTTALGMLLAEPSISSLVYGNVILALIAAILSFYLLKNRTSAFNTSLFVLFWSILMLAPRPLGAPPSRIK